MTGAGPAQGHSREVTITVNGRAITARVDTRTLLVEFIRETAGQTGTHVGCDTSQCGACVVEFEGDSVKSCTMLAVQADAGRVTTIEGLGSVEALHPMQQAFTDYHALQCGFCTPGMVMGACDLLRKNPCPSGDQIREWLDGNLCRCTGYNNIVAAIASAARELAPGAAKGDAG